MSSRPAGRRPCAALLAGVAALLLALTLGACGGSGNTADVSPRSTPEITPPSSTQAESEATHGTSTTTTSTTSTSTTASSSAAGTGEESSSGEQPAGAAGESPSSGGSSAEGASSTSTPSGSELRRQRRHWGRQRGTRRRQKRLLGGHQQPHGRSRSAVAPAHDLAERPSETAAGQARRERRERSVLAETGMPAETGTRAEGACLPASVKRVSPGFGTHERPRTTHSAGQRPSQSQPRSVAMSTACARSTAPSLP